ncbi:hypothetical protein SASPL_123781 [Salvia splendens]|uniref:Uncharacterized protein n=1 Tax=Salvia splendens TaxID=180675 RepID=A0A8X8ZTI3_SALSN|nr:hypothetical protein SASPL_123781 [Salvia splendens]
MGSQQLSANDTNDIPLTDVDPNLHIGRGIAVDRSRRVCTQRDEEILIGVGFNADGNYKIDIDDEQWAQVGQRSSGRTVRREFGLWIPGMRFAEFMAQRCLFYEDSDKSSPLNLDELYPDHVFSKGVIPEMVDESTSVPVASAPKVPHKKNKKRKAVDSMDKVEKIDSVLTLMTRIHEDTNDRLKEISSRIGYEFDLSTKRTNVFNQVKGMVGLTIKQQFYAAKSLLRSPSLWIFFGVWMSLFFRPSC